MPELANWSSRIFLRIILIGIGVAAIFWASFVFPVFRQDAAKQDVAAHILTGDDFRSDLLAYLDSENDLSQTFPNPTGLRSSSIIRLRRAELALASQKQNEAYADLASLNHLLVRALTVTPTDSFLWLALFWTQNMAHGYGSQSLEYLKMSYICGPREGWVAARRNRLAIALFGALPSDIRIAALSEFNDLVMYGYMPEAAKIFVGPGWSRRDLLILNLSGLPRETRDSFNASLAAIGYDTKDQTRKAPVRNRPSIRQRGL
jgi:hypothetical protein